MTLKRRGSSTQRGAEKIYDNMNRFEKVNAMNVIKGLNGSRVKLSGNHNKKMSCYSFRDKKE